MTVDVVFVDKGTSRFLTTSQQIMTGRRTCRTLLKFMSQMVMLSKILKLVVKLWKGFYYPSPPTTQNCLRRPLNNIPFKVL